MAWKPSGVWNKPTINLPQQDDSSFPGLKPAGPDATTKIQYEELQQNELMALEAIYGEDFIKHKDTTSAWKRSDPSFEIKIRPPSNDDFAVTLGVVLTATYPKTPPLLTLKDSNGLRDVTRFKIQKYLETQPKMFAQEEQEMIDGIVEGVREILEDAAQAKAKGLTLPSLEQERAAHEEKLAKQAKEQREADERRRAEESKEEERVLGDLLEEELKRQKERAREQRKKSQPHAFIPVALTAEGSLDGSHIIFDRPCRTTDKTGNEVVFQAVTGKSEHARGPVSTIYVVRPVVPIGQECPVLALKETRLRTAGKDVALFKRQAQALESLLESLKSVHHRNLLDLLDFRVERGAQTGDGKAPSPWTFTILTPFADKGSLDELLDLAGHLEVGKVRAWTRDLLDALSFLHNKSVVHQDIHTTNILLFREPTGEIVPKLSDAGYQRELHGLCAKTPTLPGLALAKSAYWLPPEIAATSRPTYTQKTDVWDFGVVFLQMIFGLDVLRKYHAPSALIEALPLSNPLQELVTRFFKQDSKKRPRAFELGSSEFLATDAPVVLDESSSSGMGFLSPSQYSQNMTPRLRRESSSRNQTLSRYEEDFVEEGRLGKGGFGEVVKARKKLDGQIYAIKKISQRSQASLTEILKEVRLLSQLSHPAVVRYYNTWVEEIPDDYNSDTEEDMSTEADASTETLSHQPNIQFATSTGGLDFMSSSGFPHVEFGYDESGDEDEDDEDADEDGDESSSDDEVRSSSPDVARDSLGPRRTQPQRPYKTILYISMEYCEKRTLRDLISRKLYQNTPEIWRIFRQILEGLAHIHSLSIVHRDLKPENIFIAHSVDGVDNVKIGDFGLATSGQFAVEKGIANALESDDITRSIGTASYAAPEVRSGATGTYSHKVDMYSLGVIFFEMCYPPMLGMQRADVIGKLRRSPPVLPPDFKPAQKTQTEIVCSLLTHNPKDRPSSVELLRSGKLPVQMENETIRRTLAGLADPSSPYYQKMLSTLFSRPVEQTKDYAWEMHAGSPSPTDVLNQNIVKKTLISIFRRHGALEVPRNVIYPKASQYGDNVVRLLDSHGTVLQLPYDLTLGHARVLAKQTGGSPVQRTYTFGNIFRDRQDGQPLMLGEVDFDIVTTDTLDLALKEAEVIKVLDEIVTTFPSLSSVQMCFHLGHSELLQLILEFCRIEHNSRRAVADVLSKLNIHGHTFQKLRRELRSPLVGVSAMSLDELQRFDFRDTPSKAFSKLKTLFEGTNMYQKASSTLAHLKEVYEYAKRLGVVSKIYINPLSSLKENFYKGGILFSCLYDKKFKDVFAAGGRYDSLIKEYRPRVSGHFEERHAVGFNLAWEKLARVPKGGGKAFLKKVEEDHPSIFNTKRCDVLVGSFDAAVLRSTGIEILRTLWAHNSSAELANDARSPEDLLTKHRDESCSWLVIIKQDDLLKIKTLGKKDNTPDVEIGKSQLVSWLRAEIRERDSKALVKNVTAATAAATAAETHTEQDVRVLVAQNRSKKFNRRTVVEKAQQSAANLVQTFLEGPILAVEASGHVLDLIQETSLSDGESWRKLEQSVTTTERHYVRDIRDMLTDWRSAWEQGEGSRHCFLYNFRTEGCIYYDLGA